MNTVKFITFTDVHVSDTNPASRLGDYREDILNKLRQIGKVGKKLGVDFYILAGDLFHFKAPMRNSHALVRMLIEIFQDFGAPIYTTEGNHDLRRDSYDNFGEQPLSVLYATGVLHQVRNEIIKINDSTVRISGIPFTEEPDLTITPRRISHDENLQICILHLYATKKGGELFGHKLYSYDEISSLGDDIFVLGHYHVDQGIERINTNSKEQIFVNVGAISRGSLSEDEITREPKICYVSATTEKGKPPTIKAQSVKLRVKPAEEVFNIEKKKSEKKEIEDAERFVGTLQKEIENMGNSVETLDEEIEKTKIEKPVIAKVKHYLTEADLKLKEIR
jgi:DNA repair exonuclease SbcCD nuclease subunit